MLIIKNVENKAMYSMQELHLCLFSFSDEGISTSLVSSIFLVHSSANLSTNLFFALTIFIV